MTDGEGATDTATVTITVTSAPDAPTITEQPADRTVVVGQPATFRIAAQGTEPLSYQWQRDGYDIPGATDGIYTTGPVTLSDGGARFGCVVESDYGRAESTLATLHVVEAELVPVTVSFGAEADTYVDGRYPSTNYGTSSSIELGGGSAPRDMYLRFNIEGLPAGAVVTDAYLIMSANNSGDAGTIREFVPQDAAWNETAPTWSNPVGGVEVPVDLASPGNVNKRSTATYSGLAPAISGNGRVTFVISSNEQDGSAFYSREDGTASRRPLLNVTYWSY